MVKINTIYLYQNEKLKNPYVVITKKTKGGYYARRVTQMGSIATKPMLIKTKAKLLLIKEAKVIFSVEMPKRMRDEIRYMNLITRANELKLNFKAEKIKSEKEKIKSNLVRLALASFDLQNVKSGRRYNLKDFSKALKFKKDELFYSWVEDHLKRQYNKEHFRQIETCADRTLKSVIDEYRGTLPCYLGHSKKIDSIINKHFLAYVREYKKRSKRK